MSWKCSDLEMFARTLSRVGFALVLLLLAFAAYRFCRGVWCRYHGRGLDGRK